MSAGASRGADRPGCDVVVVGGGPAGLTAALYLGRARRRTLVVDAGRPRNAASPSAHGVFTRDGATPAELLAEARRQLSAYAAVELRRAEAVVAASLGDGFVVRLDDGTEVRARRLLLACGIRDELPDIEGLAGHWGRGVLHCTTCHGYEVADRELALVTPADAAVSAVASVLQVSRDLVLCASGASIDPADRRKLDAHGVRIVESKLLRITGAPPQLVLHFADGSKLARQAVFVRTVLRPASELPAQLGCRFDAPHRLHVSPNWETSAPGVYAAGDIAALKDQVAVAAASGAHAAIAVHSDLSQEDFRRGSR